SGYRSLCSKPKITTLKGTPICGAARPAPFAAFMVSRRSASNAARSSVPKRSTAWERSNRRGSPIRKISLIIGFFGFPLLHDLIDQRAHLVHRALEHHDDLFHRNGLRALAAS